MTRPHRGVWGQIAPAPAAVIASHMDPPPTRLAAAARALGLAVKAATLDRRVSGGIRPVGARAEIRVNRAESRPRQRLTVALEIAHWLLHPQLLRRDPAGITHSVLYRSHLPEGLDARAMDLALDIVLPAAAVVSRLDRLTALAGPTEATATIALEFEVTRTAAAARISRLDRTAPPPPAPMRTSAGGVARTGVNVYHCSRQ